MPPPPPPPPSQGRTGRPPLTSRTQIVAAAHGLIDRDGWEKLTVRRLAAEIGVGATTLYHHIRNKDDLLVLLLNEYVGEAGRPPLPADPQERVVTASVAMRDALAAWPWAAEVLSADGFVGLLDESALWMVEAIVAGARDYGCTSEHAIDVFRSIWYFTVGEVLVRAHTARRRAEDENVAYRESFDASQVPHLAAVGHLWAARAATDIYPQGLRTFVDGLLAQTTPVSPTRTAD